MPLLHAHFFSKVLDKMSALYVVLPDGPGPFPVVYQLHGQSDDYSAWLRRSTIELFAERQGMAVVMPDGGRSYYCDSLAGGMYEQHILECVAFTDCTFRTIPECRARGIGGLSMGGFGALKLALKYPQIFASAVSHSGALDANDNVERLRGTDIEAAFFPTGARREDDPFSLIRTGGRKPALYIDCGVDDFLIERNRAFHALLNETGVAHTYREHPGAHTWDYWQAHVDEGLAFHHGVFAHKQ